MKTFKQFLMEMDEVQDAGEFFHREAQPFIQQAKGAGVFLRGADNHAPTITNVKLPSGREVGVGVMTVRKNRKPMNMPIGFHEAADEWMKETFDINGRSGSAFVLGERGWTTASFYGEYLYAVIPRGEFKFIWSPKVNDLYDQYSGHKGIEEVVSGLTGEEYTQAVREELSKLDFRTTDLPGALTSRCEVMIECEQLLVVNVTGDDRRDILQELKEVLL